MNDEINKQFERIKHEYNHSGQEDSEGYSLAEMKIVLYDPFNELCPVQLNHRLEFRFYYRRLYLIFG